MRTRLIATALWSAMLLTAMWVAVAQAQTPGDRDTNLDITEFGIELMDTPHAYPPGQAGGNPDVALFWRFCGPGVPIASIVPATAPSTAEYVVHTARPFLFSKFPTSAKIRGYTAQPQLNGYWRVNQLLGDTDSFEIHSKSGDPDLSERFSTGAYVQFPNGDSAEDFGCVGEQPTGRLQSFKLRLPPGFVGNPTATVACPTHLFIASSCPARSALGYSITETIVEATNESGRPSRIQTAVYNVATMGLEPARLGTGQLPSEPAGPIPIKIDLRTTGDYGIDSTLIDIPKNLGGPQALVSQIETVLCAEVPCAPANPSLPQTVEPVPPARPFFRNSTSCKEHTVRFQAKSWARDAILDEATDTLTTTGCTAVPFDPTASIADIAAPPGQAPASLPGQHRVTLQYPPYEDAPIWQANLRNASIKLPKGMVLNPAGGYGLEQCTSDQFGVNSAGKQISKDPPTCPEGSQVGTLTVSSPVLPDPIGGKVFFGQVNAPGQPTRANPWKLYLLIEGAGLRIKLVGDVTVADDGQISNFFVNQPEVPFDRLDVTLRGGDNGILRNPETCGR